MQLYNTLTRKKEKFQPIEEDKVRMYVCGITAYDLCHIGHARSAVVFDVLVRFLRHIGYEVTFVRNFTDVDDKIIAKSQKENRSSREVADTYIQAFYEDMDRIGVLHADIEPKCTDHIDEMIAMTQTLIEKGQAYTTLSGDVYFRVRTFDEYGRLSNRNLDELRAGTRIVSDSAKEDPLDFALWKSAKPGEPWWESPWGKGRPGWHLECSAMSAKYLKMPLDIHGGGHDLIFPHHENEMAQTKAALHKDLARYWVHNGFVRINQEKMSKSLGNFFTIRDILQQFLPETLRYFLLTQHYRSPLDFSMEAMEEAEKGIRRIYSALACVKSELLRKKWSKTPLPAEIERELDGIEAAWDNAMQDDLNTAGALGQVFTAIRLARRIMEEKSLRKSEHAKRIWERILSDLHEWGGILGLFHQDPESFLLELRDIRAGRKGIQAQEVEKLLQERMEARKAKDFARSDTIRDQLASQGVEIKDTPQGQQWDVL
ncbi:MAG: cysteine--tRNA ligase [Desulfovibrionales bacterium]